MTLPFQDHTHRNKNFHKKSVFLVLQLLKYAQHILKETSELDQAVEGPGTAVLAKGLIINWNSLINTHEALGKIVFHGRLQPDVNEIKSVPSWERYSNLLYRNQGS
jgi:hypothetical protein